MRNFTVVLLILSFLGIACKPRLKTEDASVKADLEMPASDLELGEGWNSLLNLPIRASCLQLQDPAISGETKAPDNSSGTSGTTGTTNTTNNSGSNTNPPNSGDPFATSSGTNLTADHQVQNGDEEFTAEVIIGQHSLQKTLGVYLNADFQDKLTSKIGNLKGDVSYENSSFADHANVYVLVRYQKNFKIKPFGEGLYKESVLKDFKDTGEELDRLRWLVKRCGDRYVRSLRKSHVYVGILTLTINDQATLKAVQGSLSAALSPFKDPAKTIPVGVSIAKKFLETNSQITASTKIVSTLGQVVDGTSSASADANCDGSGNKSTFGNAATGKLALPVDPRKTTSNDLLGYTNDTANATEIKQPIREEGIGNAINCMISGARNFKNSALDKLAGSNQAITENIAIPYRKLVDAKETPKDSKTGMFEEPWLDYLNFFEKLADRRGMLTDLKRQALLLKTDSSYPEKSQQKLINDTIVEVDTDLKEVESCARKMETFPKSWADAEAKKIKEDCTQKLDKQMKETPILPVSLKIVDSNLIGIRKYFSLYFTTWWQETWRKTHLEAEQLCTEVKARLPEVTDLGWAKKNNQTFIVKSIKLSDEACVWTSSETIYYPKSGTFSTGNLDFDSGNCYVFCKK